MKPTTGTPRGQASLIPGIGVLVAILSLDCTAALGVETQGAPPRVRLEEQTVSIANSIVEVPVLIANAELVDGLKLSIHYDGDYLAYAICRPESDQWFVEAVEDYPRRLTVTLRRPRRPADAELEPGAEHLGLTVLFTLKPDWPGSPFRVRTPLSLGSESAVPDIASTHFFVLDAQGKPRPVETLKRSADVVIYYQDGIEVGGGAVTRREQVFELPLYLTYFKSDRNIFTVGIDYDELFLTILGVEGLAPPLASTEVDTALGSDGKVVFELVLDNDQSGPFVHLHVANLIFRYNGADPIEDLLLVEASLIDTQGLALRAEAGGGGNYGMSEPGVLTFLPAYFVRGNVDSSSSPRDKDSYNAVGNMTDAMLLFDALFKGGAALPCNDAADVNNNGLIEVSDVVHLLNHLYRGGAPPRPPYPQAGFEDPAEDPLDCARPLPLFETR
jgi:hypothetical protein